MKRYAALFLTVVMVLFLPFQASAAYAVEIPVTASQTSVVMDISTGQVLVEKEMNQKMYPAGAGKRRSCHCAHHELRSYPFD